MRVDCIGKNKIKISLNEEEVLRLFGGYDMIDYSSQHSKATLNSILASALPKDMLPIDCSQVLIEIRAENKGCAIYFTKIYKKYKKTDSAKHKQKTLALTFSNTEDLIRFVCQRLPEKISSSRVFSLSQIYILIITFPESLNTEPLYLKEFCQEIIENEYVISHICEHGKLICENAELTIKSAFKEP